MGNKKNQENNSRRQFFSSFFSEGKKKIKMLTADGKLVEIDQSVYNKAAGRNKTTNKDIYEWMDNPSKKTDQ